MDSRSRRARFLIAVVVVAGVCALITDASAQVPVPTAPPTASAPGCHTEDASGQPATLFGPGDRLVVKGEGFGGVAAIRVTFVQGSRTLNVTTAFTDELGVFTADSPDAKIPDTAAPGPGEIHAFSTSKVAVCAVQVMAAAGGSSTPRPKQESSPLFGIWIAALVAFGLFLLVVIVRRWRARRLASAVAAPVAPDVPRLVDAPVISPVIPDEQEIAPIFSDEPPPLAPEPAAPEPASRAEAGAPPVRSDEPVRSEAPLLDLIPQPDEPRPAPRPAEPIPPPVRPADDVEEFVFRDGKWRLRDELDGRVYETRPPRADVADARDVADALRVPRLRKDASEPPLLDPVEIDLPEWWSDPLPTRSSEPVEGTVSDTVARLVENTKDWTKR